MKAKAATKSSNSYKDPKDLKQTLTQIKGFAKLGFSNACFQIPVNNTLKIAGALGDLGYQVFIGEFAEGDKKCPLDVQW